MTPSGTDALDLIAVALSRSLTHLSADEVYEIGARGGEGELNDLLRHSLNRLVRRRGWLAQREVNLAQVKRVDLAVTEPSSGRIIVVIESKMLYLTDPVDAPDYVASRVAPDARKLRILASTVPTILLMYSPYYRLVHRKVRYMRGHPGAGPDWLPSHPFEECDEAMQILLARFGTLAKRVVLRDKPGEDGHVAMMAYLVALEADTIA